MESRQEVKIAVFHSINSILKYGIIQVCSDLIKRLQNCKYVHEGYLEGLQ